MTSMDRFLDTLKQKALELGASDATIISKEMIVVENEIIDCCKNPLCESFGKSLHCPPHAMKPERFREFLSHCEKAVIFKNDVSPKILLSNERFNEFRKIYEIATGLEQFSKAAGFSQSKGLAAGSCKPVFCPGLQCQALMDGNTCRYPNIARPAMEAVGIHVFKLVEKVGWKINKITENSDPESVKNGILVGMVLVA
ncbi:MAG: DUF2284 domain-containing protein [Desulfobacterales bacterium]